MKLLVGTRKGFFVLEDGQVIGHSFAGTPITAVLRDPRDASVYAVAGHGHFGTKVHHSVDGGATFSEIAAPEYPPRPDDAVDVDAVRGTPIPWRVEMLWTLAAGHTSQPGTLWAGTIPGGLFRSDDRGTTWSLNRPLWDSPARRKWFGGGYDFPGIHSICPHPDEPDTVVVGVSCGGTWITTDGGQVWTATTGMRAEYVPPPMDEDPTVQDPHCVTRCRANPDVMWTQHHNFAYRSTDGGRHWHQIHPAVSSFGFAVAAHPHDSDTAWFVPAVSDAVRIPVDGRVVVTRTTDGGKSWDTLTKGLPSPTAFDLIYRHALDVNESGDHLAMGSTTGSLWASADGGEQWDLLTAHLPPIACVRFA